MTEELVEETIEETEVKTSSGGEEIPPMPKDEEPIDELDAAFQNFKKSKSEHKVEPEAEAEAHEESTEFIPENVDMFDNFKLQMFMGLLFTLLDGIHLFLFKFVSKYELKKEDIALDEADQEGLQMYFQSKRVLDFINRIPVELMGFIHLEYLYMQKYKDAVKSKEEEEEKHRRKLILLKKFKSKKGKTEDPEAEEVIEEAEEVEEEAPEPKPRKKRKPRKKARRRKTSKPKNNVEEEHS